MKEPGPGYVPNPGSKNESSQNNPAAVPTIDVKEGAKISGYGEKFEVNLISGTPSFSIPLPAPAVRGGAPSLALSYSGTKQNSPFGMGFSLGLPSISRLTDRGTPRYGDKDVFLLSGSELTPRYTRQNGKWVKDERTQDGCRVIGYRPRVESGFAIIEHWIASDGRSSHWVVTGSDNSVSVFGSRNENRVSDPASPERIFEWNIDSRTDASGNRIEYAYRKEDGVGLPQGAHHDGDAQRYIASIRYGNYTDVRGREQFACELLFDYGDYDPPSLEPVRPWPARRDAFSTFRPGFHVKTWRLCRNILAVKHFPDLPEVGDCLSGILSLEYVPDSRFAMLRSAQWTGYRKKATGEYVSQAMPPLTLTFSDFKPETGQTGRLDAEGGFSIPDAPGKGNYQFVDLWGDGIPGILYNDANILLYYRALGDGRYAAPVPPLAFPVDRLLSIGSCSLMDVEGSGRRDLVVHTPDRPGYYRNTSDGKWENFVPFPSMTREFSSPEAQFADLNADGRQDILLAAGRDRVRVYESLGSGGFAAPSVKPIPEAFPVDSRPDSRELTTFADIFGDGLQHRVRLRDGELTVWPSLSHGTFADPVRLPGVPRFDAEISTNRLYFADVTGSGYDDIVLVHDGYLAIHLNQSGNGFGEEIRIEIPQRISDFDQISFADVLGDGRAAFVLSKVGTTIVHHYRTFSDGVHPYLLTRMDNGYGAHTEYTYRCSTHYQLADRAAGKPWATSLSMPVQVIDQVRTEDIHTGLVQLARYQYADGYYDPVEREFRGFAYAQAQNTQAFAAGVWHFPAAAVETAVEEEPPVEPALTRQWNHTGAPGEEPRSVPLPKYDGGRIVPADVLDPAILSAGERTIRQAYGSLRNLSAAGAVFGLDTQGRPGEYAYTLSGQNYLVTMIQPALDGHYASFMVTPRQSRAVQQDARPGVPLVADSFALDQDKYGNVTFAATVNYPKRNATESDPEGQRQLYVAAALSDFINHPASENEPYHYIGVACQSRALEVSGLCPDAGVFSFDELRDKLLPVVASPVPFGEAFTPGKAQSRLMQWSRSYFYNAERTGPLPLGSLAAHALPYQARGAVFPESFVASVYGDRVTAAMLEEPGEGCGYVHDEGYWWNPGAVVVFGDESTFFSPLSATDPHGATSTIEYDAYFIAQTRIADALGQVSEVETDYQTLQPRRVRDINENYAECAFDPLGRPVVSSRYGSYGGREYGDACLEHYEYRVPENVDAILADPEAFLQGAGTYVFLDEYSFLRGDGPVCGITVEASRYATPFASDEPGERTYVVGLGYTDGAGRALAGQTRVEAAALPADTEALKGSSGTWAWITSGQVAYSPQGEVARAYHPFITAGRGYVPNPPSGYDSTFFDAAGRIVKSVSSKGYYALTRYYPWYRVVYDANDTIMDSPYYLANIENKDPAFKHERDALVKGAAFHDTPTTVFTDPQGRDIVTRLVCVADFGEYSPEPAILETGAWYDAAGNVIREVDPRFYNGGKPKRFNFERIHDMAGRELAVRSLDNGNTTPGLALSLFRAGGEPLVSWDHTGLCVRSTYDVLCRPLATYVAENGSERLANQTLYGDDPVVNTRGQSVLSRDQAAESRVVKGYTIDGQPVSSSVRFSEECAAALDWSEPSAISLAGETWTSSSRTNRLGWPLFATTPDGSIQAFAYYANGWARSSNVTLAGEPVARPVVVNKIYSAHGGETEVTAGNGVTSGMEYDPQTLRLRRQRAFHHDDGVCLQDLSYFYDAAGNITRTIDGVTPPDVTGYAQPDPISDYTYDSVYRLRLATGRQQATLQKPMANLPEALRGALKNAVGTDVTRLIAYTERYTFDEADNLIQIKHMADAGAGQGSWVQNVTVAAASNHAVPEELLAAGKEPDDYFDERGNMAKLPNLRAMRYDYRGKLTNAVLIERDSGANDENAYAYGASGERVRRVRKRMVMGGGVQTEETLYLGPVVLTRTRLVADDGARESGQALSLKLEGLVVNREQGRGAPLFRYQLEDIRSSVSVELDGNGNILTWEEYFPFGSISASLKDAAARASKLYRYAGKELDQDTGLYCMGQRYYACWLGRWLTPDPIGSGDGLNVYAYVKGNPIKFNDLTGLCKRRARGAASGDEDRAKREKAEQSTESSTALSPSVEQPLYLETHEKGKFNYETNKDGKNKPNEEMAEMINSAIDYARTSVDNVITYLLNIIRSIDNAIEFKEKHEGDNNIDKKELAKCKKELIETRYNMGKLKFYFGNMYQSYNKVSKYDMKYKKLKTILSNYQNIRTRLNDNINISIYDKSTESDERLREADAYTDRSDSDHIIFLNKDKYFLKRNAYRGAILIHEVSHYAAMTEDYIYFSKFDGSLIWQYGDDHTAEKKKQNIVHYTDVRLREDIKRLLMNADSYSKFILFGLQ